MKTISFIYYSSYLIIQVALLVFYKKFSWYEIIAPTFFIISVFIIYVSLALWIYHKRKLKE